jgi:hypothetical protein
MSMSLHLNISINRLPTERQQSGNRASTERQQSINSASTERQQSINRASTESKQLSLLHLVLSDGYVIAFTYN